MKDYIHVQPGEHVWVGGDTRGGHVRQVLRLTNTQIVLAPGGEFDRFDRMTGAQKAAVTWKSYINGVATPEDVLSSQKKQEEEDRKRATEVKRQAAIDAKQKKLRALFTGRCDVIAQETRWLIRMHDLSEEEVRQVARVLDGILSQNVAE